MQKLSQFKAVQDALTQVATEMTINHNNGSYGKSYFCHYWNKEDVVDKEKQKKEIELARAILLGSSPAEVLAIKDELAAMPKAKVNLIFKLIEPIKRLKGSKIAYDNNKTYSPVMENVEYFYISEDTLGLDVLEFEELQDSRDDIQGNPTPIINLRLTNAMLDVKEGMLDWKDNTKELRAPRAWVTPISFRSMQIVGKIMNEDKAKKRGLYSYLEN